MLIFAHAHIIAVVTIARVLIRIGIAIIVTPIIIPIGLPGLEALTITSVHRILQHSRTIAAGVVVSTAPPVAIVISQRILILRPLQTLPIPAQLFVVILLISRIPVAFLISQLPLISFILAALITSLILISAQALVSKPSLLRAIINLTPRSTIASSLILVSTVLIAL